MIQLIGLHSECTVEIREKLSIIPKQLEECTRSVLSICDEVVIISTCNRTEIYFNSIEYDEAIVEEIFRILKWDLNLIKHTFHIKEKRVFEHLMEVVCGFHSKILGEDQILGQVKCAIESSVKVHGVNSDLQKLFQIAITCGKKFRDKSKIYKIPVSSSSIVVKEAINKGLRRFMLVGFGDVGALTLNYILSSDFDELYIAVRNVEIVKVTDSRVKIIRFEEKNNYYSEVDCIICCTSAPHPVVFKSDLPDKKLIIYDLALPRDVEKQVLTMTNIVVYDIDKISAIDDENRKKRKELMQNNKYIVEKYVGDFIEWQELRKIDPHIKKLLKSGETIYYERYESFKHKQHSKDNGKLAMTLLKSTSDAYINRAIEVLKEEQLKGRADECLRIVEKIFYPKE
ncbi:glutamyl-tRNA reductase [Clostridium sp.]|uniref:glutamyl-tRNA reductase n=1 Tax=Clostridium sp. TaxID=1506 RepID=UPI001A572134|nr:glutamyl-tRNA reductase [Clostridium sp.]MBK5242316.1 glutamyl-tRNA reductase [Clostridium sp.]